MRVLAIIQRNDLMYIYMQMKYPLCTLIIMYGDTAEHVTLCDIMCRENTALTALTVNGNYMQRMIQHCIDNDG